MTDCKKCGSEEVTTKYIEKDEHITSSGRGKHPSEFIYSSEYDFYWKWTAEKEHLRKTCNDCGNEWLTKCLDAS
jgi:hypothetical protein